MEDEADSSLLQARRSDRIHKPPQYLKDYIYSATIESSCFSTLTSLGWTAAMQVELQALEDTGTWEIVSLPYGKKPIACK